MNPKELYQGDRIRWVEPEVPVGAQGVTVWLRGKAAGAGAQAVGVNTADGWMIELTAQVTSAMVAGDWALQVVATVDGASHTVRRGSLTVRRSLAFSGTPGAFDDRSQDEIDLDAIKEAIRALVSGAQEYQIGALGSGGRKVRRADLAELRKERDDLISRVAAARRAEALAQGVASSRRILVRFEP